MFAKLRKKKRQAVHGGFIFVLLIWTVIFLLFPVKPGSVISWFEEYGIEWLVNRGYEATSVSMYTDTQKGEVFFWKLVFGQDTVWSYLSENSDDIELKYKDGVKQMVMLCPGYGSKGTFWSGAAGDMAAGDKLFKKSDGQIAKLEDEEAETAAKIIAENQANGNPGGEDSDDMSLDGDVNLNGETYIETEGGEQIEADDKMPAALISNRQMINKLKSTKSRSYLLKKFYITDSSTSIDKEVFDVGKLLSESFRMKKKKEPQILILHTHAASEAFIDSRLNNESDSIVGVGSKLTSILEGKYGYNVIHDTTLYDKINGSIDRSKAYNKAAAGMTKLLKQYPSIEVIIDLHRDGVGNKVQRTTVINGKRTAQVMFFNGLSRNSKGDIAYLYNPNLQSNLAFSLQLKLSCMEKYENFARPVYLKSYRYNLQMRKCSLLIELGNENNTVEEAKNAMEPLAEVLDKVLSGK